MFVCSAEERCSCRFGTTWGWISDGGIKIFGCTIPFKSKGLRFVFIKPEETMQCFTWLITNLCVYLLIALFAVSRTGMHLRSNGIYKCYIHFTCKHVTFTLYKIIEREKVWNIWWYHDSLSQVGCERLPSLESSPTGNLPISSDCCWCFFILLTFSIT